MKLQNNLVLSLSMIAILSAACVDEPEDTLVCTAAYVPSVVVSIVRDGEPVTDLSGVNVSYRLNDGEKTSCVDDFMSYRCGFEQDGSFAIFATDVDGYAGFASVRVEKDRCHAITEHVSIDLGHAEEAPDASPSTPSSL